MSFNISASWVDFSVDSIYLWISDLGKRVEVYSDKDIEAHMRAYMSHQGYPNWKKGFDPNQIENFRKALSAFSFVKEAQFLRVGSEEALRFMGVSDHFKRDRISYVFNQIVGLNRELISPSVSEIDIFSSEWNRLQNFSHSFTEAACFIQQNLDARSNPSRENPSLFPAAYELFLLERDPRIALLKDDEIKPFLNREYIALSQSNCFRRTLPKIVEAIRDRKESEFSLCIERFVTEPLLLEGASLLKIAHAKALENPSSEDPSETIKEVKRAMIRQCLRSELDFSLGEELYQLGFDQKLPQLSGYELRSYLDDQYPHLAMRNPFKIPLEEVVQKICAMRENSQDENLFVSLKEYAKDLPIIRAAILFQTAQGTASHNQSQLLNRLYWINRELINTEFFGNLSGQELDAILSEESSNNIQFNRELIQIGAKLKNADSLDEPTELRLSLMSKNQKRTWDERGKIIDKAAKANQLFIKEVLEGERLVDDQLGEALERNLNKRDAEDVTEQFVKDYHRSGHIILSDKNSSTKATQFPGQNEEKKGVRLHFLAELKKLATVGEEFDPILYAHLQNLTTQISQATPNIIHREEFLKIFKEDDFGRVASLGHFHPERKYQLIEKIDDTQFKLIDEYVIPIQNFHAIAKGDIDSVITAKIHIEYTLKWDANQRKWVIGEQRVKPIREEKDTTLVGLTKPTPLPPLAEEEIELSYKHFGDVRPQLSPIDAEESLESQETA